MSTLGALLRGLVVPERLLFLEVGLLSQVQEVIVDEAYAAKCTSKRAFLLVGWNKAVFVGSFVFHLHAPVFFFYARIVETHRKEGGIFSRSPEGDGCACRNYP
jgi:hypothetical protein